MLASPNAPVNGAPSPHVSQNVPPLQFQQSAHFQTRNASPNVRSGGARHSASFAASSHHSSIPLGSYPLQIQEVACIDELLFVMLGFDGNYIRWSKDSAQFQIVDSTLDPSLAFLVQRILPVCTYYVEINRFVEANLVSDKGFVNHALSASLRNILKAFMSSVTDFETLFKKNQLTLQKMWCQVQETLLTMKTLNNLCQSVHNEKLVGGALLSYIDSQKLEFSGNQKTKAIYDLLLSEASKPFFEMLSEWIHKGVVRDPHAEFLIHEHRKLKKETLRDDYNDMYWEQRYTVRQEQTPSFLKGLESKILMCGKYLNVLRECGVSTCETVGVSCIINEKTFLEKIEKSYILSSKRLLAYLMKEEYLLLRLRTIKQYFLMSQGDYLVHFIDTAEHELQISTSKLQSLMELVIRSSSSSVNFSPANVRKFSKITDPSTFKDDIKVDLASGTLLNQLLRIISAGATEGQTLQPAEALFKTSQDQLTGMDLFTLDCTITFPMTLVLSKKALTKYQILFRNLFQLKNVERALGKCCISVQKAQRASRKFSQNKGSIFGELFELKQLMYHFVHNIVYYIMAQVLEPNWQSLESKLKEVETVDEVLKCHSDFLDTCLKECMLSNEKLLKIIHKLLASCLGFSSLCEALEAETDLDRLGLDSSFVSRIREFKFSFFHHMKLLIDGLCFYSATDYEHHMESLVDRLNFNGYYSTVSSFDGTAPTAENEDVFSTTILSEKAGSSSAFGGKLSSVEMMDMDLGEDIY